MTVLAADSLYGRARTSLAVRRREGHPTHYLLPNESVKTALSFCENGTLKT